jgi:hypothetical protein
LFSDFVAKLEKTSEGEPMQTEEDKEKAGEEGKEGKSSKPMQGDEARDLREYWDKKNKTD